MFLPVRNDSPLRITPYMNWLLIAANVVIFIAQGVNPGLTGRYALYASHPTLPAFFTYQFLHSPAPGLPLHLIFNMLFLFIFGNNVNDKMGHFGYLGFYLAGGVFAGVCEVLTTHGGGSIIGASGAIAAVTGAYLVLFPRSNITIYYFFILIGRFELQSVWFIAFFFAQDVFLSASKDNVAHWAHIGGTLMGVLVCLFMLVVHLLPRDQYDVWALLTRWNKRRQYRDLVSKGYNPFEFSPNERLGKRGKLPPDPRTEQIQALRGRIAEALDARRPEQAASLYLQLRTMDPAQVLSKTAQLEVATQLHHESRYPQAAEAYEALLKTYPKVDRIEQVQLALGLIYARYLNQYAPAKQHLTQALDRLHGEREVSLAREELTHIELHLKPA